MGVTYDYYQTVYMGNDADEASFPALMAHSKRIIDAMTHNRVTDETFPKLHATVQEAYQNAICAQIDYLAINGIDSISGGASGGFTVGKVHVDGKSASNTGGAMSAHISPAAIQLLEQTGLMNPQVPTCEWWW